MHAIDAERLLRAYRRARDDLLAERTTAGHWVGELASSALSTATAISALSTVRAARQAAGAADTLVERYETLVRPGLEWLSASQNADGGWGDTDKSLSNIATTMLVRAAFHLSGAARENAVLLRHAEAYIERGGGIAGLRRRYGKDRTFAVPILTNCALAGLVPWSDVAPLPFELACLPQSWYRFARMPVVSYAIPALVAVGQVRFARLPPRNPFMRGLRAAAIGRSLKVLEQMQPVSGGYLEATPLTSFVVMSLAGSGCQDHAVTCRSLEFLVSSARADGSWPIDTNLATWVTTLAINALASAGEDVSQFDVAEWILSCQHRERHPFTGAAPGGWGWSDLSGAVPDADDTPGALLALHAIAERNAKDQTRVGWGNTPALNAAHDPHCGSKLCEKIDHAADLGARWLLDLQNRDGGWPTFCRGWGVLPFDCSGADLTAHALRALSLWNNDWTGAAARATESAPIHGARPRMAARPTGRIPRAIRRGIAYLARTQRADGSWAPLWFGNQYHALEENPVYGTARVLLAYRDLGKWQDKAAERGVRWLLDAQNEDGGWGDAPRGARADGNALAQRGASWGVAPAYEAANDAGPSSDPLTHPPSPAPSHKETSPPIRCSSVEETALVIEALIDDPRAEVREAVGLGLDWLVRAVETNNHRTAAPIGFYFAKLWYYERLYPLVYSVAALGRAARHGSKRSSEHAAAAPSSPLK